MSRPVVVFGVSDDYRRSMEKLGERLDPREWRPLKIDGEVVGYVKLPPERSFEETLADLARDFGDKRGQC